MFTNVYTNPFTAVTGWRSLCLMHGAAIAALSGIISLGMYVEKTIRRRLHKDERGR